MVENNKVTIKRNYTERNRMKGKLSFLEVVTAWNFKRILIFLLLFFIFIFLPLYMFNADPYDFELKDTTQINNDKNNNPVGNIAVKENNYDINPIESLENEVKINTVEKSIAPGRLPEDNVEEDLFKPDVKYIDPIENNEGQPSEKIITGSIDNSTGAENEKELSYEELTEAIRQVKSKLNNDATPNNDTNVNALNKVDVINNGIGKELEQTSKIIEVQPPEKIRTETIDNVTETKNEKELSYKELSEAIRIERQAKLELENDDSNVDIDISEHELDNYDLSDSDRKVKELNQLKTIEDEHGKEIEITASSNTLSRDAAVKELTEPVLTNTGSVEVENKTIKSEFNSNKTIKNNDIKSVNTTEDGPGKEIEISASSNTISRDTAVKKLAAPALTNMSSVEDENKKIKSEINSNKMIKSIGVKSVNATKKYPVKRSTKNKISRAYLTTGLKDKEPVDRIESPVVVNKTGITKIYYFTDIRNMEGEVLYHYWMWNGRIEFEKEIKIWGNRWRASTLKMIPFSKTGKWQARIANEDGDILNEIEFEVINE